MILQPRIDTAQILAARPPRNLVDPWQPHAFLVEAEHSAAGQVEEVATVFLTNRECPFHCLMCDLWKNTLVSRVPDGAIPAQIDYALQRLPPAQHIKLYNSANFFDPQAIPRGDWPAISQRVAGFRTVIVENHPRLVSDDCRAFQDLIGTQLEIALGLETIHPEILPRLNKQMDLADFESAVRQLQGWGIRTRAFILLRPPYLTESEGIDWACRSLKYAFDIGIDCASVIPVRGGNGIMEQLRTAELYTPPTLSALETVMDYGLQLVSQLNGTNVPWRRRVFVDLWDVEQFAACPHCAPQRRDRLRHLNLSQQHTVPVNCKHCHTASIG